MGIVTITRRNGTILWQGEAESVRAAVVALVRSGADLSGVNLRCVNLRGVNLVRAKLHGANLHGTDMYRARVGEADLSEADLSWADLSKTDMHGANLRGTDLHGTNMHGANLSEADLSNADLSWADLSRTDLSGAKLHGTRLYGTNLSEADLSEVEGVKPEWVTPLLLLHDQPGPIRLYKLVTADGSGPFSKGVQYEIGGQYCVENADCDVNHDCGAGINLATLDWCLSKWRPGYRILVAEFTAADIAVVPTATNGKIRVHACRIVGEKDLATLGLPTVGPMMEGRIG